MRIRVGRIIALAYLFCVLAPAAALAWGSGPAPCLDDAILAEITEGRLAAGGCALRDFFRRKLVSRRGG